MSALPALSFACAVCGGDSSSLLTRGTLMGVLFLLGTVIFILFGIAYTAWTWSRRAKKIEASFDQI